MVGCWTTALSGRPTFPPAVAVSAERDEIDEYEEEEGDGSIDGPSRGTDGGRMLSEEACAWRAASGDGGGALMLVLTSISHLLRVLKLSTTDDTSLGCCFCCCCWMNVSV